MGYGSVTVGTTTNLVVAANSQRFSLILVNTSTATNLYIGQDTALTTSSGILISAFGSLTEDSGGQKVYCGDIYGVAQSGTIEVRYWERLR